MKKGRRSLTPRHPEQRVSAGHTEGYGNYQMKKNNHKKQASLTVEAALILPFFLTAMVTVASFINILYVHRAVGMALANTCRKVAVYSYPASKAGLADGGDIISLGTEIMTLAYVQADVTAQLSGDALVRELVLSEGGISLLRSRLPYGTPIVDLVADYAIRMPVSAFSLPAVHFTQRARMHAFLGHTPKEQTQEEDDEEEMVFITASGVVYHRDSACTYLAPRVYSAGADEAGGLRNADGGKYYACEICGKADHAGTGIYYTEFGTRWHTDRSCTSIQHEIKEIPLSRVGGRRPCSKCGY